MIRTTFVGAAVAAAALALAVPASASPCDAGAGLSSVDYALKIAAGEYPPEPPDPTPYEPDCDIMFDECDSGCLDATTTVGGYELCVDACMDRAGC